MASMDETGPEGLETWELLQSRQLQLALRKELKKVAAAELEEVAEWETDMNESWASMQLRLETTLKANSLDHEKKPFSVLTNKSVGPDSKTTAGLPTNVVWSANAPGPDDDGDTAKQNSDILMGALKLWGLDLPNLTLIVHGGSSHPWQLIRVQQMADQRADFLKSRPHFNDTYFDGQRDPAHGWMAAGNAWRYPAFYVSPAYEPTQFTFRPPHTLFVDAALQVQEDFELIETGDRTVNEWIMDAVTHQPVGRQAAIKGADGVFYWDLNAPSLKTQGVIAADNDLRKTYEEWEKNVVDELATEGGYTLIKSKYLVGFTKQRNIHRWGSMTARLLMHERQLQKKNEDNQLAESEIRVEINSIKFNKTGHAKLTGMVPPPQVGLGLEPGMMTLSSLMGDVMVIVKLYIPGDEVLASDPVRVGRGPAIRKTEIGLNKRSYHSGGVNDAVMRDRQNFLQSIMASGNPADSLLRISVVLADSSGKEVRNDDGRDLEIATFEQSLKEMVQDVSADEHGTHRLVDVDVYGHPPPKEGKAKAPKPPPKAPKPPTSPSRQSSALTPPPSSAAGKRRGFGRSSSGPSGLVVETNGSGKLTKEASTAALTPKVPLEKPVPLARINGFVAFKPPQFTTKDHQENVGSQLAAQARKTVTKIKASQVAPTPTATPIFAATPMPQQDDGMGVFGLGDQTRAALAQAEYVPTTRPQVRAAPSIDDEDDPFSPRLLGPPRRLSAVRAPPLPPSGAEARSPSLGPPRLLSRQPSLSGSPRGSSSGLPPGLSRPLGSAPVAASPPSAPPTAPRQGLEGPLAIRGYSSMATAVAPSVPQSQRASPSSQLVAPVAMTLAAAPASSAAQSTATLPPPSPPASAPGDGEGGGSDDDGNMDTDGDDGGAAPEGVVPDESSNMQLLSSSMKSKGDATHTIVYTVAYWVMWKTVETIGDQRLLFGDGMNQPVLVRGNKLGALVNNYFCATDYDPRWNGENWQLVVVTNDGQYSKFYVGFSSDDETGLPEPAKAEEPSPGRPVCDVKTEMGGHIAIRKLQTAGKGAGLLAQAWIWPRDLQPDEVRELWMMTKGRYPVAKRGVSSLAALPLAIPGGVYRAPPNPFAEDSRKEKKKEVDVMEDAAALGLQMRRPPPRLPKLPPPMPLKTTSLVAAKVIEKDVAAMLDVPLVNKLAFQRLLNVFSVLVDYAMYSNSFIVVDRVMNFSCTAELMLELALRKNPTTTPTSVLVIDSKARLEKANHKLKELKRAKFARTSCGVSSSDFLNASVRQLLTPQGLTWLRASSADLARIQAELIGRNDEEKRLDHKHVRDIYELYGEEGDLRRDGRPNQDLIWKSFYAATLFASGTHYLIFDHVEMKGRSVLGTLGTVGAIFMNGGTNEHAKIVEHIASGQPLLLLESTGGVTQAFAHSFKAVRLMKPKWPVDYVLRLVTEYKVRAASAGRADLNPASGLKWKRLGARPKSGKELSVETLSDALQNKTEFTQEQWASLHVTDLRMDHFIRSGNSYFQPAEAANKKFALENIHLLDKELARIDLLLSSEEKAEAWMRAFGLPEVLMLFELWQRAPNFLMRQLQMVDVMKKSAEGLLDTLTGCFSSPSGVPELGLGDAEIKVVKTAWNRHLLLFHNGDKYNARSWILQLVLYIMAIATTTLAIFSTTLPDLVHPNVRLRTIMLVLPIAAALLTTVSTRLRQRQKYAASKMASFVIVSEIYKFRVRAIEYDQLALSAAVAAMEGGNDKKKDEDEMPKPISSKERDKIARRMFVGRVKDFYETCMASELASGTSISHKTPFGLDPARLLLDDGEEDDSYETRRLLQKHVADKLYYIKPLEWERGAEGYKQMRARASRLRRARQMAAVRGKFSAIYVAVGNAVVGIAAKLEHQIMQRKAMVAYKLAVARGEIQEEDGPKEKTKKKYAAEEEQLGDEGNGSEQTRLQKLAEYFKNRMGKGSQVIITGDEEKVEKLDETYRVRDDDEEEEDDAGGGNSSGRPGDNFFGPLSIDEYMQYRARPVCTYLERTAPWRAFELQFFEIVIFCINSFGAVLVGLGEVGTPYVSLTVAVAAVLKSVLEFSNLEKQVEAYNASLRSIHSMLNEWDGKTRTERRTRQVITDVVGKVETGMINVAIALCNALPPAGNDKSDGDEGEGDEKKKE